MRLIKSFWIVVIGSLSMVMLTSEVEGAKILQTKNESSVSGMKKLKAKYSHKKGAKNQQRKDAVKKMGGMVF